VFRDIILSIEIYCRRPLATTVALYYGFQNLNLKADDKQRKNGSDEEKLNVWPW
jgi:hypothetical protein